MEIKNLVERGYRLLESGVSGYSALIDLIDDAIEFGKSKASTQDTTDWHNLTAAIKAGEPIDFEALDGRRAKCEHETMGYLIHEFELDDSYPAQNSCMRYVGDAPRGWSDIFIRAWLGYSDWTLYIDGPVPMKRKTADQLEPGTEFYGIPPSGTKFKLLKTATGILHLSDYQMAQISPSYFEVVEVIGMYGQKERKSK